MFLRIDSYWTTYASQPSGSGQFQLIAPLKIGLAAIGVSGSADLPLHGGQVPRWLADRMTRLGAAISEAIRDELLLRIVSGFGPSGLSWAWTGIRRASRRASSVLSSAGFRLRVRLRPPGLEWLYIFCGRETLAAFLHYLKREHRGN
jgi:hypothetical protein